MLGYDWPRLHAALNDLPAALLLVAVLFDLAGTLLRRPALRVAGFWTLVAGAAGAILAVVSGLQAEEHIDHGEAVHQLMGTHEKLALVTLGIFVVVALWRIVRERRMGSTERAVVMALSLGGTGTLLATAVYGGKLVFDHAAGIPTKVLEEEIHQRAEGHHHHAGEGDADEAAEHGGAVRADSAAAAPGTDSAQPAGHTHAPGTPPHKD
jgi:uncharacterized membrane protein